MNEALTEPFAGWFAARGWRPHGHQLALLAAAREARATLLIAPTGGGKTLAGFLPSLIGLSRDPSPGLHTLYVSPLKALAADIRRNLSAPVEEMDLPIRVEDRTGDTSQSARVRQRRDPPHILLTTPESLALLLSQANAPALFAGLRAVIVDEAHAIAGTKRGDQLALCLARLRTLAPAHRRTGLSATVADEGALAAWLDAAAPARIVHGDPAPRPDIAILETRDPPPWAGMGGRHAVGDVLAAVRQTRSAIIFINTRAQAELFFQALWAVNDDALPIALHHGSLARETRAKVEAAMADGSLRAVVSTSSLDLGVDWAHVDLVVQVGAPKGVSRLVQRIGRANHRPGEASRALLVPANRLDYLECRAALEAAMAGDLDGGEIPPGALDILCQHILLTACAAPFEADALYAEVRGAGGYDKLSREDFDRCLDFCATGGYALRAYDRWRRLMERGGRWQLRDPRAARRLRMNVGAIVEAEKLGVRVRGRSAFGGAKLGEIEESFASTLRPGDSFLIGGEVVRYQGLREMTVEVSRDRAGEPKVPVFAGGTMAMSVTLADRVMAMLSNPARWHDLPAHVSDWLTIQSRVSALPVRERLLIETFPRAGREFMAVHGFAGRNAHQTLGLILTHRMEAEGLAPLGFVANDHALLVWGMRPVTDPAPLFRPEVLREGLDRWLTESSLMKRSFRRAAVIAGLIERRLPGHQKTGRQATFSSDILYDTLVKYDPGHLMLDITRREAMRGLIDFDRIEEMLTRIGGRIEHRALARISPLCVPLMLAMGREKVTGEAEELLIDEIVG